jgi:hypothetical protein
LMLLLQELSITPHPFICLCLLHRAPVTYPFMLVGIQWKVNPCRFGPFLSWNKVFLQTTFFFYGLFWRKPWCWMRFLNWWL